MDANEERTICRGAAVPAEGQVAFYESPLGPLELAAGPAGLRRLDFAQRMADAGPSHPVLAEAMAWLDAYFAGQRPPIGALPLDLDGTPHRLAVWQAVMSIPHGQTLSYGAIAKKLVSSPRAVGAAVGRNPISIIIPCHRVVGAGASLGGYGGGLERKLWLLRHEGFEANWRQPQKRAHRQS